MLNLKRMIAPVTSRNVNKRFPDKRITKRLPAEPGQVKGSIISVEALIYWFQKAHYAFYSHTFNVIMPDTEVVTFTNLAELQIFLAKNVAVKSGKNKGSLPVSIVRAVYNSGEKDNHRDVSRDTWISCHGMENYLPDPSVDRDGNFIPLSQRKHYKDRQIMGVTKKVLY